MNYFESDMNFMDRKIKSHTKLGIPNIFCSYEIVSRGIIIKNGFFIRRNENISFDDIFRVSCHRTYYSSDLFNIILFLNTKNGICCYELKNIKNGSIIANYIKSQLKKEEMKNGG